MSRDQFLFWSIYDPVGLCGLFLLLMWLFGGIYLTVGNGVGIPMFEFLPVLSCVNGYGMANKLVFGRGLGVVLGYYVGIIW